MQQEWSLQLSSSTLPEGKQSQESWQNILNVLILYEFWWFLNTMFTSYRPHAQHFNPFYWTTVKHFRCTKYQKIQYNTSLTKRYLNVLIQWHKTNYVCVSIMIRNSSPNKTDKKYSWHKYHISGNHRSNVQYYTMGSKVLVCVYLTHLWKINRGC